MTDVPLALKLRDIYTDIRDDIEAVENLLHQIGKSQNRLITEVNKYLFQKGGKRIRPAILILSSRLCGYEGSDHIFWGALIEIIHTASLIHDDIVDNADTRRGQDTVHARWGPNITVLLGDFLYIQSIALALRTKKYTIIDILADVTSQMIEGELIECSMRGKTDISEEVYLEILDKKTSSLFSASSEVGGILADASPADKTRLREFGKTIGLAFQLVDDLLDFSGNKTMLGKPVLSDVGEGRITLPLIYTLRQVKGAVRSEILKLIKNQKRDKGAAKRILKLVAAGGGLEYARTRAMALTLKSKEILSGFSPSPTRESLSRIADLVLQRKI
jgi:octaprenyl-diphosphate synthase